MLYLLAMVMPPLAILRSRHPRRWGHAAGNVLLLAGYPLAVAHAFWVLGYQPPAQLDGEGKASAFSATDTAQPDGYGKASALSATDTAMFVVAVGFLIFIVGGFSWLPGSSVSALFAMATATPVSTVAPQIIYVVVTATPPDPVGSPTPGEVRSTPSPVPSPTPHGASRGEWVEVEDVSNNWTNHRAMIRVANVQVQSVCPNDGKVRAPEGAKFVVVTLEGTSTWDEQVEIPYVAQFMTLAGRYKHGIGSDLRCRYGETSARLPAWGSGARQMYKGVKVAGWLLFEVPVVFDPAGTILEGSISCRTCKGYTTQSYAWRL